MGDLESLLLVLVALYLAECLVWTRRGTVLFSNWWGPRSAPWHVRHPGTTLANQQGAVLFTNPLPPLGCVVFGQQPPLSVSGEAAFAWTASCLNPTWRAVQTARLVRFEDIKTVERDGRKVLVNGELFLKAMSPSVARRIAKQLRELKDTPAAKRDHLLRQQLAASFDEKAMRERLEEFQKLNRPLRFGANSLFVFLYVLAPLAVWRLGLGSLLWWLLGGLLAHTITLAFIFRRAHGRLHPNGGEERFTPFLTMLLAPPSAARAPDALSKHLFDDFHALAVAKVLLTAEEFRKCARQVLLDLRHPMAPVCPLDDPLAVRTEESWRAALRETAEQFVTRAGVNLEELLRPPARSEPAHSAYCPRCGAQFVTGDGTCGDCGGRSLVSW